MPPTAQNEKSFKHFLELPLELRIMMIEEMGQDDRVRFSFVSKTCHREASVSKKHIYGLELFGFARNNIRINVVHRKYESSETRNVGYMLEIVNICGEKYVQCKSFSHTQFWKRTLDESTDIFHYATNYFKQLLKPRHRFIKKLVILGNVFATFDFELKELKSLEDLVLDSNCDIRQFFSKISRPLRRLKIDGNSRMAFITECEELYQVRDCLTYRNLELTSPQFSKLSASHVEMRLGNLTMRTILDFVRTWKRGTIQSRSGTYRWILGNRNFDLYVFRQLLGRIRMIQLEVRSTRMRSIYSIFMKHRRDAEKMAKLSIMEGVLIFAWGNEVNK